MHITSRSAEGTQSTTNRLWPLLYAGFGWKHGKSVISTSVAGISVDTWLPSLAVGDHDLPVIRRRCLRCTTVPHRYPSNP